jgi:Golgi nucleoside diphosphatase
MTRTYEDVARRVAQTLADRLDPKLPAQVEYVLADTDVFDLDVSLDDFDTEGVGLASMVVNAAKIAMDVHRALVENPDAAEWAPPMGTDDEGNSLEAKLMRRLRAGVQSEVAMEKREAVLAAVTTEILSPTPAS